MFYSHSLLSRKGPLGNIWIAAYCFKKLKREQIDSTDITSSIDKIMPEVQISYRLLAQLLLGIVRIFSKKVDYLYHDCNDALTNIRRSFISSQYDTRKKENGGPKENAIVTKEVTYASKHNHSSSKKRNHALEIEVMRTAYNDVTITLPERFELDAFDLEVTDVGCATDSAKHYEEFILEEERTTERNQDPFADKYQLRDMDARIDYSSACFTPIDDNIPSYMMEIDIQNSDCINSSGLAEAQGQKAQGQNAQENSWHLDEPENNGSLGVSISEGLSSRNEQSEHQAHRVEFQERMPSNIPDKVQEPKIRVEVTDSHSTKADGIEESHEKSRLSDDSGLASPKFAVTTPAKRETSRMLGKRKKNLYDETIVLPNEIIRMWIHDARSLVCKRRQAPITLLDAWKLQRMINLHECFIQPLIPCKLKDHYCLCAWTGQVSDTDNSLDSIATPVKKPPYHSPLKKSKGSIDAVPNKNDTANTFLDADDSHPEKTPTDTNTQADHSEGLKADTSYEERIKESNSVGISNSGLDVMDQDNFLAENDTDMQAGSWSTRTRAVARFLCHRFLDLSDRKQNKIQSLARILEGQTRAKCARFFSETLTLKTHDYIDVKQDHPYGDIIISASPKLENLFMDQ